MHPAPLTIDEYSELTVLGLMPPLKRGKDADLVLGGFSGLAREVAAVLIGAPSGATASEEARGYAEVIRRWVDENRAYARRRAS